MSDIELLVNIFLAILDNTVTWMVGVLPSSPFAGISLTLSAVPNALGWLNWAVPVGQCVQLYAAWLACAAVWQAAQFVGSKITYVDVPASNQLPSGGDE